MARRVACVAALAALALAACGGEGSPAGGDGERGKPAVTVPGGDPPGELQVTDLVVGTGAEAVAGTTVTVHYVGVAWSTGQEFDASWDRDEPFIFPLGSGRVIQGWEQGMPGMKVGGRRRLVIPPDLAYGEAGAGGVIGPNETLVFVIDLLEVA